LENNWKRDNLFFKKQQQKNRHISLIASHLKQLVACSSSTWLLKVVVGVLFKEIA
jgi:hypothetical protein